MRLHGCRIGCLFLLMVALASFCPWVSVVGQSGGSARYILPTPVVPSDLFLLDNSTDHYYEVITSQHLTWVEAEAAAESRTFLGVQGHLATLASEHESSFVGFWAAWQMFYGPDDSGCWVGGYQAEGSTEPDGGWQWVTGEPWDYTDWGSGEPDDVTGEQEYLRLPLNLVPVNHVPGELYYDEVSWVLLVPAKWDDTADALVGYVIEYEPRPLVELVGTVEKFIQGLPDEAFDRNPRQRRRQLADQLAQVKRMLSYGNYFGAGRKLAFDVLPRVGGGRLVSFLYRLPSPKSDWIVDADAQEQLGILIGDLVNACNLRWGVFAKP